MKGLKGEQKIDVPGFALENSYSSHRVESEDPKRLAQGPGELLIDS